MAFKTFDVWLDEEKGVNGIVPLMPALAMIINNTLAACEDLILTMRSCIQFPDELVPSMRLYMRSYFNDVFMEVLTDFNKRLQKLSKRPGTVVTGRVAQFTP